MKGTSCVRRVRLRPLCARIVPPMCFATSRCVCVRSSMRFLNLGVQIALEWLLHCRHLMLPRPYPEGHFSLSSKISIKTPYQHDSPFENEATKTCRNHVFGGFPLSQGFLKIAGAKRANFATTHVKHMSLTPKQRIANCFLRLPMHQLSKMRNQSPKNLTHEFSRVFSADMGGI